MAVYGVEVLVLQYSDVSGLNQNKMTVVLRADKDTDRVRPSPALDRLPACTQQSPAEFNSFAQLLHCHLDRQGRCIWETMLLH